MSDQPNQPNQPTPSQQPEGDERRWPAQCPYCGTDLESAVVQAIPGSDSEHLQTASPATVVAQDFCPNPDCPGRDTAPR